jgi:parallel beta-helix repeat protein
MPPSGVLHPRLASSILVEHAPIIIIGDSSFTQANGVSTGTGRVSDPHIIEGWQINASLGGISIFNTTSYFVIREVNVFSGIHGIYLHNITNGVVQFSAISNTIVSVDTSRNISILNNTFSDSVLVSGGPKIMVSYSAGVSIMGNKVSSFLSQESSGISIYSSSSVVVSNNNVWHTADAISLNNTAHAFVTGNNVSSNGGVGISLKFSPFVNITGNYIARNFRGVQVIFNSSNATVLGNVIYWNAENGITVRSNNTTLSGNTISFNAGEGIECCAPRGVLITRNTLTRDGLVLFPNGRGDGPYTSLSITPDNLVNGKPLYFYMGCSNMIISGIPVGQLVLLNCKNVRISNLQVTNTIIGMQLINVNDTLITANSANSNSQEGIVLTSFRNITLMGNNFSNNGGASYRWGLTSAQNSLAHGNPVAYHNNFFNDGIIDGLSAGIYDNGYPSGGNYWSFYPGSDNCSGPAQNICPRPDGIGDTPFLLAGPFYADIVDHYPLMSPFLLTPDTSPATWPPSEQLIVADIGQTSATLYWMRASDDVAVMSYQVWQGNNLIATISDGSLTFDVPNLAGWGYSYAVSNLAPGTTYKFRIVAVDEAGNLSIEGLSATVITQARPNVSPWWLQYWYVIAVGASGAIATLVVVFRVRIEEILSPMIKRVASRVKTRPQSERQNTG